jgi:hypothetical protein
MLGGVWAELGYEAHVCRMTRGCHIEGCKVRHYISLRDFLVPDTFHIITVSITISL